MDIGRVLIAGDGPDSTFLGVPTEQAMRARPMEGAFEALRTLVTHFGGRVHLVSKCGPSVEKKTRAWLAHHQVFSFTGLAPDHLHFCRERADKVHIARRLELDAFVDDRADVLLPMRGVIRVLVQFGASDTPEGLLPAPDWRAALAHLVAGG